MDSYNSGTPLQAEPLQESLQGELMNAFEPFLYQGPPSTTDSTTQYLPPFVPTFYSPSSMHHDGGTTSMAYPASNGFSNFNQLGFQQPNSIGLNPLTPSQIHQIQVQIKFLNQLLAQNPKASLNGLDCLRPKSIPKKQVGTVTKPKRYHGVTLRFNGKWTAKLWIPQTKGWFWVGTFDTARKAALAYDEVAYWLRDHGVKFNFPKIVGKHRNYELLRPSTKARLQATRESLAEMQKQGMGGDRRIGEKEAGPSTWF